MDDEVLRTLAELSTLNQNIRRATKFSAVQSLTEESDRRLNALANLLKKAPES